MAYASNPFIVLTYVGGPALLTNASSLFILSTANRFARAVDRSRFLAEKLRKPDGDGLHEIHRLEIIEGGRRVKIIARAISAFYLAAATFALTTLASIAGAVAAETGLPIATTIVVGLAIVSGAIGFTAFVIGAISLVIESRIVVRSLGREAAAARHLAGAPSV